jgi:hypothetical protein
MRMLVAGMVGLASTALLFPTSGVTGCSSGPEGGECTSWSESVLVRYPGENGAIGMGIAVIVGFSATLLVYFLLGRMVRSRGLDRRDQAK